MLREETTHEWAGYTKEVKNMLNVTEVCERPTTLLADHCSVIHDQNLEVLKSGPLTDYPDFHTGKEFRMPEISDTDDSDSDDDPDSDGIPEPFGRPTSQKMMHTLCFDGNNMIFKPGWIRALSRLPPKLQSLELMWCNLGNKEFQSLCDDFPKLVKLDISNSGITSLKGISKLENLEFLDISYIKFKERRQIDDIFRLKKLRELLMNCGEKKFKTPMLYVDCSKVLPKLESLDCAMCKLDQEHLDRLVWTHKKLQRVAIVGTNIHQTTTIDIPGREIELLACKTINDCIDSLTYYWEFHVLPEYPLKEIYDRINMILLFETEKVTPSEFKDCLLAMCQDDPECALNRVQALDKMTRDARVEIFPDNLQIEAIECLLAIHNDLDEYQDLSKEQGDTLKISWRILSNPRLRAASERHEDIVRKYATRILARERHMDPETAIYCFRTKMSEKADEEMLSNQDKELPDVFFSSVLRLLNQKQMKLTEKDDLEYLRKFLVYLGFRYYGREEKLSTLEAYKCTGHTGESTSHETQRQVGQGTAESVTTERKKIDNSRGSKRKTEDGGENYDEPPTESMANEDNKMMFQVVVVLDGREDDYLRNPELVKYNISARERFCDLILRVLRRNSIPTLHQTQYELTRRFRRPVRLNDIIQAHAEHLEVFGLWRVENMDVY